MRNLYLPICLHFQFWFIAFVMRISVVDRLLLKLDRNTENIFSFTERKFHDEKKKKKTTFLL